MLCLSLQLDEFDLDVLNALVMPSYKLNGNQN